MYSISHNNNSNNKMKLKWHKRNRKKKKRFKYEALYRPKEHTKPANRKYPTQTTTTFLLTTTQLVVFLYTLQDSYKKNNNQWIRKKNAKNAKRKYKPSSWLTAMLFVIVISIHPIFLHSYIVVLLGWYFLVRK